MTHYDSFLTLRKYFDLHPDIFNCNGGSCQFELIRIDVAGLQTLLMKIFLRNQQEYEIYYDDEDKEYFISFECMRLSKQLRIFLDSNVIRHGTFYFTTEHILSKILLAYFFREMIKAKYVVKSNDGEIVEMYNNEITNLADQRVREIEHALKENLDYVNEIYQEWSTTSVF